jgi:hypothetical protein
VVEAESGKILWTDRFDRPLSELAMLQDDLITDVAAQIGAQVNLLRDNQDENRATIRMRMDCRRQTEVRA